MTRNASANVVATALVWNICLDTGNRTGPGTRRERIIEFVEVHCSSGSPFHRVLLDGIPDVTAKGTLTVHSAVVCHSALHQRDCREHGPRAQRCCTGCRCLPGQACRAMCRAMLPGKMQQLRPGCCVTMQGIGWQGRYRLPTGDSSGHTKAITSTQGGLSPQYATNRASGQEALAGVGVQGPVL